jgi:hypothetical protein
MGTKGKCRTAGFFAMPALLLILAALGDGGDNGPDCSHYADRITGRCGITIDISEPVIPDGISRDVDSAGLYETPAGDALVVDEMTRLYWRAKRCAFSNG